MGAPRDFFMGNNQASEAEGMSPRDFLAEPPKASYAQRLYNAPFILGGDIYKGAGNFLNKLPEYYDRYPKEIGGLAQSLKQHPGHVGVQALAGSQEMINNLAQLPKDIVDYGVSRLQLLPQGASDFVKKITPEDTTSAINELFPKPQYPGESFARGAIRNVPNILGVKSVLSLVNPLKLMPKNIAKSIIEEGENQVKIHNNLYNNIWDEAKKAGINEVKYDPSLVNDNMQIIKKYKTPREYKSVEKMISSPTLENAQRAQSDLSQMKRALEETSRTKSLTGEESALYKALEETENHIEINMFKDAQGNIHQKLLDKYKGVSNSYRKNVVPYRYNADIQAFKNQELLDKQLVERLKQGEFGAKKGAKHPELYRSEKLKKALLSTGAAGGALAGGATIYNYLTGKPE